MVVAVKARRFNERQKENQDMNISDDDWFELPEKIDMIQNPQTQSDLRDMYMSIEAARLRGMRDQSSEQRYLKNAVDFILKGGKHEA